MASKHLTTEDFFREKYASEISRSELNSRKVQLCRTVRSGMECQYGVSCNFSHHPSKLFDSVDSTKHYYWNNGAEFQMWVLAYAKSNTFPKEDKAKMGRLFDHVINNPATFDLKGDIETYNNLRKEQKEQEDRAKDAEHKLKKAQNEQLRREADKKERKDRKQAEESKANEQKEVLRKRCEEIVNLRESVYKSDHSFLFEASFLPSFMKVFLQKFDIQQLSNKIKLILKKDLMDEPEDLLTAIETFLKFISAVTKLERNRQTGSVGDQKKNSKRKTQFEETIKEFEARGVEKIFSQLLGSPVICDLKVNSAFSSINYVLILSILYFKKKKDKKKKDNGNGEESSTLVETVDEEDLRINETLLTTLPAESSAIRNDAVTLTRQKELHSESSIDLGNKLIKSEYETPEKIRTFGHNEYLAVCAEVLQHNPEVQLKNCCKKQQSERTLPLIRCLDCESCYCKICISNHARSKKAHLKFSLFCPECKEYRDLVACSACSALGNDFLICEDCQSFRHDPFGMHDFELTDFDTMTLVLATSSQSLATLLPQDNGGTNIGSIKISNVKGRESSRIVSDGSREETTALVSSMNALHCVSAQKSSLSHGFEVPLSVPHHQLLSYTEVEKKPEHFDSTERQIRMARVRALLEDVAHPILEQLLRLQWQKSGGNYCPGCRKKHPFEDILIIRCISDMVSSTCIPSHASVFRALGFVDENTTVAHLSVGFDVTSIIQIIQAWTLQAEFEDSYKYFQSSHLQFDFFNSQSNPILKWRNKSFHPLELSHEDYEECFKEVPDLCFRLYNILLDKNKDKKDKIFEEWKNNFGDCWDRINNCKISFTRRNIEKHMKEQWLLESKRSMLTDFGRYLESQCMEFTRNSKCVGERLCDSSNPSKFLIIPKLIDAEKVRHRLEFLTKLPWAGIIDLNYPFLWSAGNLAEFLPMTIHFEDEFIIPADESSFGATKTLYVESIRDISRLLKSQSLAYVVGFVEVDYDDEDGMDRLKSVIQHFHDNDVADKNTVWPLVEDGTLLTKTSYLWKTKKRGKRSPLISSADPQELTDYTVSIFCSIDLVAAVVFGWQRRPQTLLLDSNRQTRIGIPLGWIAQFSCVEVLSISSDVFPKYTSTVDCNIDFAKFESNKLRQDFDDSFIESEFRKVLKAETFNFLNGGEASWFLLKQDRYVVKRAQLEGVVQLIRDRDHLRQITIVHKFCSGGTTFARHVLYRLHTQGFVCLVVNDSIKGENKIDNFVAGIRRLNALTDNKVVILIDLKRDRAEVSEPKIKFISIVKDKCHAFTTFMVTTSEEEWISYYRKDSHDKSREKIVTDSEEVVVLNSNLDERETEDFGRLLKEVTKAKTVSIDGVLFPVDQFGSPDLNQIKTSERLMEIINNSRPSELMDAGLSSFDLHELGVTLNSGDSAKPSSKSKSRMSFLGLLQFNLEFRDHVRKYIQRILDYLSYAHPRDVQVLKLCVFYCLFTPTGAVNQYLAQYVHNDNGRVSKQKMLWSPMLLEFIEVDNRNYTHLYMKSQQLGYLLAETKQLFGRAETSPGRKKEHPRLRISILSIRNYIIIELFPIIFRDRSSGVDADDSNHYELDSPQQKAALHKTLLDLVSEGLLHALCDFKIWHPGSKPIFSTSSSSKQKATLDNAFLLELIIFGNRREGTNFVRMLFERVIKEYGDCPKELGTFSTHAARFIAYQAQVRMDFELINEADKLVKDLPLDFKKAECLGNIRKREVLIYLKQSKYVNPQKKAATAKQSNENGSEDDDESDNDGDYNKSDGDQDFELQSESQQLSDTAIGSGDGGAWTTISSSKRATTSNNQKPISRHCSISSQISSDIDYDKLSKVLAITEEGSRMFDKAIIFHKSVNTHPMVASVQTWINFLKYFRNILNTDQDAFVALLFRKSTYVPKRLELILDRVQKLDIIEKCSRLLTSARKAILYKSMNSGYEYHDKSTMSLIKDNQKTLRGMLETKAERHLGMDKPPIHFNMTKARILLVRGNVSGLDETELCYCLATCAIELVQRNSNSTVCETSSSIQNTFDDSFYDTLEKFYLASSLITYCYLNGHNNVSEKISLFREAAPVSLSDAWRFRHLLQWFDGWSNFIKEQLRLGLQYTDDGCEIKTFYGLDTHICIVLLYLWKVLQVELSPEEKKTYMSRLNDNLKLLWDYSDGCQNAMVPRIFLGKKCAMSGNPFSQFIQAEQMKSSVEIRRGDRESQELEYRSQAKLFKILTGSFHKTSQVNNKHVMTFILCHELENLKISCEFNLYGTKFSDGDDVSFILGITNRGFFAYGLMELKLN